jgi:hypothetical protein
MTQGTAIRMGFSQAGIVAGGWLACLLLALCAVQAGQGNSPPDISRYVVSKTLGPITIDGVLDEPSWKAAPSTGPFGLNDGSGLPQNRVEAKILWDDEHLYFAFDCGDSDLFATMRQRDQHLWEEEVVEMFIDPDGDGKNYLELQVNPLSTFLDIFILTPVVPIPYESYTVAAKWAVKVNGSVNNSSDKDKGWSTEIRLPLKEAVTAPHLPPKQGDKWRLGLYRIEQRPVRQLIAWSPTLKPSFHTPSRFGEITFSLKRAGE